MRFQALLPAGIIRAMSDVTKILAAIEQGDPQAASQLLPLVYDELRRLAAQKLAHEKPGQTLEPTALVHEAYLRLVGGVRQGRRPASVGCVARAPAGGAAWAQGPGLDGDAVVRCQYLGSRRRGRPVAAVGPVRPAESAMKSMEPNRHKATRSDALEFPGSPAIMTPDGGSRNDRTVPQGGTQWHEREARETDGWKKHWPP